MGALAPADAPGEVPGGLVATSPAFMTIDLPARASEPTAAAGAANEAAAAAPPPLAAPACPATPPETPAPVPDEGDPGGSEWAGRGGGGGILPLLLPPLPVPDEPMDASARPWAWMALT